jgi:hypothetical protein
MWEPRRLTTVWAPTAYYRDSFTFYHVVFHLPQLIFILQFLQTHLWPPYEVRDNQNKRVCLHFLGLYPDMHLPGHRANKSKCECEGKRRKMEDTSGTTSRFHQPFPKRSGLKQTTFCVKSIAHTHNTHHVILTQTVSETMDNKSILIWPIARKDFILCCRFK